MKWLGNPHKVFLGVIYILGWFPVKKTIVSLITFAGENYWRFEGKFFCWLSVHL